MFSAIIIVRNQQAILHGSEKLKNVIPDVLFLAYRRPKNLRDFLLKLQSTEEIRKLKGIISLTILDVKLALF